MANNQEHLGKLLEKIELLLKRLEGFNAEVNELKKDVLKLRNSPLEEVDTPIEAISQENQPKEITVEIEKPVDFTASPIEKEEPIPAQKQAAIPKKGKSDIEKFIGENLINKIGILITIIGVVIGAKYSIENNLISPLTRIILGYALGLGLIGFGIKLKVKYTSYSAVLVSGALAIMYFITFAGYSFYELFPQIFAFGLMLLITVFGVVASLNYNKQIIAHIGLVSAYAVPFLLSNDSGNVTILFSYIAIINLGILFISLKKYWKALYYVSFAFTWLSYLVWRVFSYRSEEHYQLALLFLVLFFIIFYATFLGYKLIKSEKLKVSDVFMLLLNSFIFYALGFSLLEEHETGQHLLGLFTLANAIVHFGVTAFIYKNKLADKNIFYLAASLVLTFITIAIPVQLDGNWVTLLWTAEATLLFWIGRSKQVKAYEYMSYPLLVLAFLSLTQDWGNSYNSGYYHDDYTSMTPILNSTFLTGLLFLIAFSFINWIQNKYALVPANSKKNFISKIMVFVIPSILLFVLYSVFYLELEYYFYKLFWASEIAIQDADGYDITNHNYDLKDFQSIWLINYSLFFMSLLSLVNNVKLKNRALGIITLVLAIMVGLVFLTGGLYTLSELRDSYLSGTLNAYYNITNYNIWIRYVPFTFFGLLVVSIYKLIQQDFLHINFKIPFELLIHTSILWIVSSELINWMAIAESDQSYKLGMSILWGVYALLLIILGIWKNKKYLRISAIMLFGLTLVKLFFYDIASLNGISKTIVFVSLGLLLLIISFLYNKYKYKITDENEA
ncbi:DUF2339 domain-containing protein [Maribacter antarcticus]|uniref:DUF2339 domain-containing protein n=1 Tax=Maribacter antarcticus TaxID=505250 RepID=UPI00047D60B4|nr:DUF2339 domain-containing protein [Maribacter antarcticus]